MSKSAAILRENYTEQRYSRRDAAVSSRCYGCYMPFDCAVIECTDEIENCFKKFPRVCKGRS